ncbi:MAG: dynamin family protein [Betaproteobacteria bacterium]|nr:dynamin family protein [Betaproteobacteria bacterium]
MTLAEQFSAYSRWRNETIDAVLKLRSWLNNNDVCDARADQRLQYLIERLRADKLTVAFVAEFSRGKSELINAIFFAEHGGRILPSSAGRTTMCPTELQWAPGATPELRLLPIGTRVRTEPVSELKLLPECWTVEPLDTKSTAKLQAILARVSEVNRVTEEEALDLGFKIDPNGEAGLKPGADSLVEVPRWRHAVIQFPHPLLEQGLVVLDTPGLNAIGAEPELTLSLLPNAHAVLFILAADTGVTLSDMTVWRDFVSTGAREKGRLVVLNKIDGLWDGLRDDASIDAELERQVKSVSETLEISEGSIFPVSAQKGLVARVNHDKNLLVKSRLLTLERVLSEDLLPSKQEIVRENTLGETRNLIHQAEVLLQARLIGVKGQLQELDSLHGKNRGVVEYMMYKIRVEKDEFEQGLKKYYAVRSVFTGLSNQLLSHLGMDTLRIETRKTRDAMLGSRFSLGLREAMKDFFQRMRTHIGEAEADISEIYRMLDAMYKRFSVEHGLKLTPPEKFSVRRCEAELNHLESVCHRHLGTPLMLVTTEKRVLMKKFFETAAVQVHRIFEAVNRDVDQWLRAVMAPLEIQVREYQLQLKRRLESVRRIHQATDTLENRVEELKQSELSTETLIGELMELQDGVRRALDSAATITEEDTQPLAIVA